VDEIRHAGLIARYRPDGWRGLLIEGPSGAGKSELAWRAMEHGFRLVADDRTLLWRVGAGLFGRAPQTLAGLIELRGVGVLPQAHLAFCQVALVVRAGAPDRLPEPAFTEICGVKLSLVTMDLAAPAAAARLGRVLDAFDVRPNRGI
jgi:hypothetical protein